MAIPNKSPTLNAENIAAVIVLYYPDITKILSLLSSIQDTVNSIILIDNSEQPEIVFDQFDKTYPNISYINLGGNQGIGSAQNMGIELARNKSCSHVIFFDQDSHPKNQMISNLLNEEKKLLANNHPVGAIGPKYLDEKSDHFSKPIQFFAGNFKHRESNHNNTSSIQVDFIISSGSLIRLSVFEIVGNMREDLFIDAVDVEWILRASSKGFRHFISTSAIMTHCIGDNILQLGPFKIDLHKEIRNFYKIRNLCFLISHKPCNWRFIISMCFKIPVYILTFVFVSELKLRSIKLYSKALMDGFTGRLGKFDY